MIRSAPHDIVLDALRMLLRPICWFCMNRSLGLQDIVEQAKIALIEVAVEECRKDGNKINVSRLSTITGVHRKDVVRIYREEDFIDNPRRVVARVIGRWREDPRYLTKNKRPRQLEFKGTESEFSALVESVCNDVRPAAILFDLERVGAVTRVKDKLKLNVDNYIPKRDAREGFRMLSGDVDDLLKAVVENIFSDSEDMPNYHAKSVYDNISPDDLPKIREWFYKQCADFQSKAERFLAKYDLDVNPKPKKKGGARVALGIFTKT